MFYVRYMHQNINLLLYKATNLCLYDQTYVPIGCWQHNLFHTWETPNGSENLTLHSRAVETTTCCVCRGLSSPKFSLKVLLPGLQECSTSQATATSNPLKTILNFHLNLFHWALFIVHNLQLWKLFPLQLNCVPHSEKCPCWRRALQ